MRPGWVLALLAACATERSDVAPGPPEQVPDAELAEQVGRFIDEHRPDNYETVFDAAETAPVDRIRIEWQDDDRYELVAIAARGETADIVRVESWSWFHHLVHSKRQRVDPMKCQWAEGAWVSRATIPRAEFDRFARKVALIERARSRAGIAPKDPVWGGWSGTFSLRLGDRPPIERVSFACSFGAPLDDDTRALLIVYLILGEIFRWPFQEVPDPETVAPLLLEDLGGTSLPWQKPARIRALGRLGCSSAEPVLKQLGSGGDIRTALAQIRLLRECRGANRAPVPLMDLAASGKDLQPWALALLSERFPDACRAVLYRRFDSRDRERRDQALSDLHAFDPADLTLARRASRDRDARLRVRGAVMLDDWALLLVVAGDTAAPAEARIDAVDALTDLRYSPAEGWSEPPGDRQTTGQALIRLLDDPSPAVRCWAAGSIGAFGYREAVPALLTALGVALSEPVDEERAAAVAGALGYLRAKEAIQPLGEALDRHASENLGVSIGLALASMADPDVLPILKRHEHDDLPYEGAYQQCFRAYESFRKPDLWRIFESHGGPGAMDTGPYRYLSELLADRLTVEELRAWASRYAIVERALALKEGRG